MYHKFVFIMFFIYIVMCLGILEDSELSLEEFSEVLKQVPEKDKYDFVSGHLLTGLKLSEQGISVEEIDGDRKLSLAIYDLLTDENEDIQLEKQLALRSEICFPAPVGCFDPSDAGIRPT